MRHFAAQLPGGALVDRFGARRVGLAALGIALAGNVLALAAASFPLAFAARLLAGVGTGAGFVAGSDWVRAASSSPAAQGLFGGFSVGGGGLAIAAVPLFEPALGWRSAYVMALAVAVAPVPVLACAAAAAGLAAGVPFAAVLSGAQRLRPDAPAAAIGLVNVLVSAAALPAVPRATRALTATAARR